MVLNGGIIHICPKHRADQALHHCLYSHIVTTLIKGEPAKNPNRLPQSIYLEFLLSFLFVVQFNWLLMWLVALGLINQINLMPTYQKDTAQQFR